jgi:rhodanese-related sulfurtransferase
MQIKKISPQELYENSQAGTPIDLIDVKTPFEYRELHATMARSVPLETLDPKVVMAARNGNSDRPLYAICRGGDRGHKACEKFVAAGYENVYNVEGGTRAWEAAGLPVVRGKKAVSLERQVRIAAGFLVLVGSLLTFVNPYFAALPAFVGAGLMFAGITDSCGMGMVLARMPWNQVQLDAEPAPEGKEQPADTCCGENDADL